MRIKISESEALTNAIANGFTTDDSGNTLTENDELDHYDHNGDPDDHAYIYRLWTPDGNAGIWVAVHDDREEVSEFDANGRPA
jgi:hypothetical protein